MNIEFAEKFKALAKQTTENTARILELESQLASMKLPVKEPVVTQVEQVSQPTEIPVKRQRGRPRKS